MYIIAALILSNGTTNKNKTKMQDEQPSFTPQIIILIIMLILLAII